MAVVLFFSNGAVDARQTEKWYDPQSQRYVDVVPGQVIVKLKDLPGKQIGTSAFSKKGHKEIKSLKNRVRLLSRTSQSESVQTMIDKYRNDPSIEYVEPNFIRTSFLVPNDQYYNLQWMFASIDAESAWTTVGTYGSSSVNIAIIDTGVRPTHQDLASNLTNGYNTYDNNATYNDVNGHGTHVAGLAAALTDNTVGVAGMSGNSKIIPIRASDTSTPNALFDDVDIMEAIDWAVTHDAHVINMSLGGPGRSLAFQEKIMEAHDAGIVICAAMGNDSNGTVNYPAAYPSVIGVGALDVYGTRAAYSNFNKYVDVTAPGGDLAALIRSTYFSFDDSYADTGGTSMACPLVSGLAALILAKPGWGSWSNFQIEAQIKGKATPQGTMIGGQNRNNEYGYGSIEANNAVGTAYTTHTISVDAGANGYIFPHPYGANDVLVGDGLNEEFVIQADSGYVISSFEIDGIPQSISGTSTSETYEFLNVTGNRTIMARFSLSGGGGGVPSITGITPSSGPYGTSVTITGTSFEAAQGTSEVDFNGTTATNITSWSDTQIVCTVPSGCASGNVAVTVNGNPSNGVNYTVTFTVTASAGAGGSISPSGTSTVNYGANRAYTITPSTGYYVSALVIDGATQPGATTYSFNNVTANHTIIASFDVITLLITSEAGPNGTISPLGTTSVPYGGTQSFTITPDTGYEIDILTRDAVTIAPTDEVIFTNVTTDHAISVSFKVRTFTIRPYAGPNGTIDPSTEVEVVYGSSQAFTMTPDTGHFLNDIFVDGLRVTLANPYIFSNVTSDHTIVASFDVSASSIDITMPSGVQGTSYSGVMIAGQFTNFVDGISNVTFSGNGITVSNISVSDPFHLTFDMVIAGNAVPGARTFNVITSSETVTAVNGFLVLASSSTPPAAPSGLSASSGPASVSLSWATNSEPDISGYKVYRCSSPSGTYQSVASAAHPTLTYTDTAPDGTYYYKLSAYNTSNIEGLKCSYVIGTIDSVAPPAPTVNTYPSTTCVSSIVISGTKSADTSSVLVNGSSSGTTYPSSTAWRATVSLTNGSNAFVITARDHAGNISPSVTVLITRSQMVFTDADTGSSVIVPSGACTATPSIAQTVYFNPSSLKPFPYERVFSGNGVNFSSNVTNFDLPVTVTMPVPAGAVDPAPYYWDPSSLTWKDDGVTVLSVSSGAITFTTSYLGLFAIMSAATSLDQVIVYPNPYSVESGLGLTFNRLSGGETIRIFTVSGEFVAGAANPEASLTWTWDLKNAGNSITPGVYLYLIAKNGATRTGKIAVIK